MRSPIGHLADWLTDWLTDHFAPLCKVCFQNLVVKHSRNQKSHYRVLKYPPLDPIRNYISPGIIFTQYLTLRSVFVSSHVTLAPPPQVFSHVCYISLSAHPPTFNHPNNIKWWIQTSRYFPFLKSKYSSQNFNSQSLKFKPNSESFEAFTMVTIQVFWVVTPCSVIVGYQRFRGPYCLHL
jgi:hypothetical protein